MDMVVSNKTEAVAKLSQSVLMNTYGRLPMAFERGEGSRLWDIEGNSYLDFISGLAVNSLGHGHPIVKKALVEAADSLIHTSNLYYIPAQAELADVLTDVTGFDKAFFCNSGAEANEAAIKLARRYQSVVKGRSRFEIITLTNSFHGRTLATVTATGQPKYHAGFRPLPEGFRYAEINDIDGLERMITDKTAAVFLEPIQGEAGVYPCTPEYLKAVRELCDRHGLLLIFDEVQTGVGRTGQFLAAHGYDVKPDIVTLAKGLAGGVPIGCTLATNEVARGFEPGSHASTFGGNPLACRVGLAVVREIIEGGILERVRVIGGKLRSGLEKLTQGTDAPLANVRGAGLMLGADLTGPGEHVLQSCIDRGLLVNVIGNKVIRLLPPLIATEDEIDEALDILGQVFKN